MMRVRTTFVGLPGAPYLLTTYWSSPLENDAAAATASNAVQSMLNNYAAQMANDLTWAVESAVAIVDPATGEETAFLSGPVSNTGVGVRTENVLPEAVQGHVNLVTNDVRNGRRIRGGLFFPGVTVLGATPTGGPTSDYLTNLTLSTAFLLDSNDPALVVWSRPRTLPTPQPGQSAIVQAITITNKFASLRSRRD